MKALERGPADTYLYSISHLELYFGNTTISREVDSAVKLVRKLAKRPNQLKTLKLELWHGIRTVKNEIDILKRLEQVKVSRRLTLVVWYTRTDEVDFGRLKQWQATSMGEGAYAVESASVETDETMWEVYPLCTRMQWVLVPKSS